MEHLKPWLLNAGFTEQTIKDKFIGFGQGFKSMSPALRDLESIILEKKLRHGGHPILQMCASNAVIDRDPAGNRKLSKKRFPLYNRALVLVLGDHFCSCATTNVGLTELHKFCFVYTSSRPRNSSTGKSHTEASQ